MFGLLKCIAGVFIMFIVCMIFIAILCACFLGLPILLMNTLDSLLHIPKIIGMTLGIMIGFGILIWLVGPDGGCNP